MTTDDLNNLSGKKRERLAYLYNWADTVVDKAGQHIEPEIKDLVIYLNAIGIPTSFSCEGHYGSSTDLPTPWVSYSSIPLDKDGDEQVNWQNDLRLYNKVVNRSKYLRKKLRGYLRDFYTNRDVAKDVRLDVLSEFYGYRLVNSGGMELQDLFVRGLIKPSNNLKVTTLLYRAEMNHFKDFLKRKYLN